LKAVTEERAKAIAQFDALKVELATNQAAHEQAKTDAQAATENYSHQLSEAQQLHLVKQGELMEQIQKISAELQVRELICISPSLV
jgi:ribosomal protein S4